jgi:antitoxin component HigA of HigAB toxin-antitoxin module
MDIRPIRNEMDYQLAISELERLGVLSPARQRAISLTF